MEAASFVAAAPYTSLWAQRSWTKSKGQPRDCHQESHNARTFPSMMALLCVRHGQGAGGWSTKMASHRMRCSYSR
jgi:hypothetical protein